MGKKISELSRQTNAIYNDDFLLLDRNKVPFRIFGNDYKSYCSSAMNSPVRYYYSEDTPCSTKNEMYELGYSLISNVGIGDGDLSEDGIPIRIYANSESSELGWMFHLPGTPNKIRISFKVSYIDYEEGDSTSLTYDTFLETYYGLFEGTESLNYKIVTLEEE